MTFMHIKKILLTMLLIAFAVNSFASEKKIDIDSELSRLESNTEGRLGVYAINTSNDHIIEHRSTERFPTMCTSKVIGVAAVLKKTMDDPSLLNQTIKYKHADLTSWVPITKQHLLEGMTVKELSAAAISYSDNTAMNLLLKKINGIDGMNQFASSIGDKNFRQDNDWPKEAYSGGPNNVKDSSTPKSMVESFKKITLGKVLSSPQRDLLISWLIDSKTGSERIKRFIPKNWIVGNKTGTGGAYGSTNDIAIIWPPNHAPILIGIYYTTDNKNSVLREDIIATATKALIKEFISKDDTITKIGDLYPYK